jgi:hypothetical protein
LDWAISGDQFTPVVSVFVSTLGSGAEVRAIFSAVRGARKASIKVLGIFVKPQQGCVVESVCADFAQAT